MDDEKKIRKLYGEAMWHLCRSLFSTMLEESGLLSKLLEEHFNPSRYLYDDIVDNDLIDGFKDYIYQFTHNNKHNQVITDKSVRDLLSEVGYDFYECHSEEDIQSFKKYYAKGEELCTFNGGRLKRCYVFFALKKNVDEIKRENFKKPLRQDLYGTSVISIQFTKGEKNTLSIKNRYNHLVKNPDATFSNNLENINSGLTHAFEREYGLTIDPGENIDFEILDYVKANDGKFYKYNYEINNIYYCPDNIIIDNYEINRSFQEKERYLIVEYFILDLVNKEIKLYDNVIKDSFVECNQNIKNIIIKNVEKGKIIELIFKNETKAFIQVDDLNHIISYINNNITEIGDNFLFYDETLLSLIMRHGIKVGDNFLSINQVLINLNMPNTLEVGDNFLCYNEQLMKIDMHQIMMIGNNFMYYNDVLTSLYMPDVVIIKDGFLKFNHSLVDINVENIIKAGDDFLASNNNPAIIDIKKKIEGNVK